MKIAIAALLLLSASSALADFYDGNGLLEMCKKSNFSAATYAIGVYDAERVVADAKIENSLICLPTNVTVGQIGDIVCKYLADNPAKRHYTAARSVLAVLIDDFPCKR
jgi:hypothetical protein